MWPLPSQTLASDFLGCIPRDTLFGLYRYLHLTVEIDDWWFRQAWPNGANLWIQTGHMKPFGPIMETFWACSERGQLSTPPFTRITCCITVTAEIYARTPIIRDRFIGKNRFQSFRNLLFVKKSDKFVISTPPFLVGREGGCGQWGKPLPDTYTFNRGDCVVMMDSKMPPDPYISPVVPHGIYFRPIRSTRHFLSTNQIHTTFTFDQSDPQNIAWFTVTLYIQYKSWNVLQQHRISRRPSPGIHVTHIITYTTQKRAIHSLSVVGILFPSWRESHHP